MFDIAIIGAGVSGCAIARELSRFKSKICVLEKAEDLCCGTSKANSGIVHAGYDAVPGTLMAKLNVEGNFLMEDLASHLNFPFKRCGSLVTCHSKEEIPKLHELKNRGEKNGVKNLKVIENPEELFRMEPNLSGNTVAALFAPTGGIVCPFGLTVALGENAAANGVEFIFNAAVTDIQKKDGFFQIVTANDKVEAKVVINAAGISGDVIHNMVSHKKIRIVPRRGEYLLLDKDAGNFVNHTIFSLPGPYGKGVLVTPTVHGNLLVGPTAEDIEDKDDISTTQEGLDKVKKLSELTVSHLPLNRVITSFAGLRATEAHHDFIIGEVEDAKGFLDVVGIQSPGLTSAPAIGRLVAEMAAKMLSLEENPSFNKYRKGFADFHSLSQEEKKALIAKNPLYGKIICRCESITEAEIVDAISRNPGAKSLDGIKRRVRGGMGRCQGGFCSPTIMELLSRELKIPVEEVTKCGGKSQIVLGCKGGSK